MARGGRCGLTLRTHRPVSGRPGISCGMGAEYPAYIVFAIPFAVSIGWTGILNGAADVRLERQPSLGPKRPTRSTGFMASEPALMCVQRGSRRRPGRRRRR